MNDPQVADRTPPVGESPGEPLSYERLVDLFQQFSDQSTALRSAYAELEDKVAILSQELARKDRELYSGYNTLVEFQTYLDSILESLPIGIVVQDLQGNVTRLNRAAADLLELSPDQLTEATSCVQAPSNDQFGVAENQTLQRASGSIRVRSVASWLLNRTGEKIGIIISLENISLIEQLERRIEEQKTLVALGEMAAHVAHELRNPLLGISGFAQMLLDETPESDSRHRLACKINEGVETLNRIATTLLNYTRTGQPTFARCDLQQLLRDIAEWVSREPHSGGALHLQFELPEENPLVLLDRELMQEALLNLSKNARQAMPTGGTLTYGLWWDLLRNRVNITISDTGVGIAPENVEKIFNPFFTTRSTGTGLGLAVVHKIIRLHNGTIRVDSTPGSGTRFTMELPIV